MSAYDEYIWRGTTTARLEEHERRLGEADDRQDKFEERLNGVLVKVGVAAGLGGVLAAPFVGAIIWLVSQ